MQEQIDQLRQQIEDLKLMLVAACQEMNWTGSADEIISSLQGKADGIKQARKSNVLKRP